MSKFRKMFHIPFARGPLVVVCGVIFDFPIFHPVFMIVNYVICFDIIFKCHECIFTVTC